jgi:Protein of unknown function (DUF664)
MQHEAYRKALNVNTVYSYGQGFTNESGESPSLRRILIDLIEEYARYVGHADLIRESGDLDVKCQRSFEACWRDVSSVPI